MPDEDPFAAMDIPGGNVSDEDGNNLPFGLLDGPNDDSFSEEAERHPHLRMLMSTKSYLRRKHEITTRQRMNCPRKR
jgi:hypothetical protein